MADSRKKRSGDPQDSDYTPRRRWQSASVFASRNWLGAIVLFLAICSAGLTIKLVHDLAVQQKTADTEQASLTYDNRLASHQGCKRANEDRRARIDDILDTRSGNLARAKAWDTLLTQPLPPPILSFAREERNANEGEAKDKLTNARKIVESQASVAKHPNAANLKRASVTACNKVYPLPAQRGQTLPQPTLPRED